MLIIYRNISAKCSRILTNKNIIKTSSIYLSNETNDKKRKLPDVKSVNPKLDKTKRFSFVFINGQKVKKLVEQNEKVDLKKEQESAAVKLAKLIDKEEAKQTAEKLLRPIQKSVKKKSPINKKDSIKNSKDTKESKQEDDKKHKNLFDLTKIITENKNEPGENKRLDLKDLESNVIVKQSVKKHDNYSQLQDLTSGNGLSLFDKLNLTNAATKESIIWSMHYDEELRLAQDIPPINGFDEMIQLTNQGKLWKFPIDNEQGVDESDAGIPFHEHIFLDQYLEQFPPIEPIQNFMTLALNGISQNSFLSLKEKKEIIEWYKGYFDEKLDIIKEALEAERLEETYRQTKSEEEVRKEKSPIQI